MLCLGGCIRYRGRMRSLEFDQSGSPRTPTEEDSGGCLFRLLCNPCFWSGDGETKANSSKDVSSYYESRVGKIRTRIARVLNCGNINVNSIEKSSSSEGKLHPSLLLFSPFLALRALTTTEWTYNKSK